MLQSVENQSAPSIAGPRVQAAWLS